MKKSRSFDYAVRPPVCPVLHSPLTATRKARQFPSSSIPRVWGRVVSALPSPLRDAASPGMAVRGAVGVLHAIPRFR